MGSVETKVTTTTSTITIPMSSSTTKVAQKPVMKKKKKTSCWASICGSSNKKVPETSDSSYEYVKVKKSNKKSTSSTAKSTSTTQVSTSTTPVSTSTTVVSTSTTPVSTTTTPRSTSTTPVSTSTTRFSSTSTPVKVSRKKKQKKSKRSTTTTLTSTSTTFSSSSYEETYIETTGPSQKGVRYITSGMTKGVSGRRKYQFYSDESSFESDAKPNDHRPKEAVGVVETSSYTRSHDMDIELSTSEEFVSTSMLQKPTTLVSESTSESSPENQPLTVSSYKKTTENDKPKKPKKKKDRHAAFLGMST